MFQVNSLPPISVKPNLWLDLLKHSVRKNHGCDVFPSKEDGNPIMPTKHKAGCLNFVLRNEILTNTPLPKEVVSVGDVIFGLTKEDPSLQPQLQKIFGGNGLDEIQYFLHPQALLSMIKIHSDHNGDLKSNEGSTFLIQPHQAKMTVEAFCNKKIIMGIVRGSNFYIDTLPSVDNSSNDLEILNYHFLALLYGLYSTGAFEDSISTKKVLKLEVDIVA